MITLLPTELHLHICNYIDVDSSSIKNIRLTCKKLYNNIDTNILKRKIKQEYFFNCFLNTINVTETGKPLGTLYDFFASDTIMEHIVKLNTKLLKDNSMTNYFCYKSPEFKEVHSNHLEKGNLPSINLWDTKLECQTLKTCTWIRSFTEDILFSYYKNKF